MGWECKEILSVKFPKMYRKYTFVTEKNETYLDINDIVKRLLLETVVGTHKLSFEQRLP